MKEDQEPDYPGQLIKLAFPGKVYFKGPALYRLHENGEILEARNATDAEVMWWETHRIQRETLSVLNCILDELIYQRQQNR